MKEYPYNQNDHDEAVGIGCLIVLVAMTPILVTGLAMVLHSFMMFVASIMTMAQGGL